MQSNAKKFIILKYFEERNWSEHIPTFVLILILGIFFSYSVFIAFNLQPGIIPDEPAHFLFSKHFSTTWGIPPDIPKTYRLGWYIEQNPFLFYWINGRIINFLNFIYPSVSDWQTFVFLRLVNAIYSVGTALFCWLLSKELIKSRWWQLLPIFLLTNTLMFVFLSGGVNYDNLANLFSIAGIYFWVRALYGRDFIKSSLAWLICVSAGALVKYPVLPLVLATFIGWFIFVFINRKDIFPLTINKKSEIFLGIFSLLLIIGNLALYGYNLVLYQGIRPQCTQILTLEQCQISPYLNRYNESALDQKLTITESINMGYPDPISYTIDSWIPNMFYRIFGILGHKSYFPTGMIIFYRLLFFWTLFLIIKYWKRPSFAIFGMMAVFLFYTFVLLFTNYDSELVYGFQQIAIQGRYLFPVIGIAYVLFAKLLTTIPNKSVRIMTLLATVVLFFMGGPIKFIVFFRTIFSSWFF